jgi:2-oxoglutarate ferredoxin oxidoreductase subunit delta
MGDDGVGMDAAQRARVAGIQGLPVDATERLPGGAAQCARADMAGARVPMDLSYAHVPKGQVFVIPNRCKGCKFCIEFCPKHVLDYSEDINEKGYRYPIVAKGKEGECIHCRFCDLICPELAIYTRETEAEG